MSLDPKLLEILACPEDKGPLYYFEDEDSLYNPRLKRRYLIRDDIPIMLIDEAETVADGEHQRLVDKASSTGISPNWSDDDAYLLDTQGMWSVTADLPEQIDAAATAARGLTGLPDRESIENVVVLGMGGSGIAGDILIAAAGPFLPVPVAVCKSYTLPAFVSEASLVFAVSCSGDTEETLEAASEAALQGARIICVTGGGELARLAQSWSAPMVAVPAGIPQPRAAIGAMAIPPLIVLEELGLFPGAGQWVDLAVSQLQRRRDRLQGEKNDATEIARRIGRTIPLMHGGGALGGTAAARWKTQINENANAPAFSAQQPELCHNEVQGWGQHGDVTRQMMTLITLRHDHEHPQVSRRFELVNELMREIVADIIEVRAEGDGELAQLLDLIMIGDFVSLHLAAREGIDPGPVPALVGLKEALAERE